MLDQSFLNYVSEGVFATLTDKGRRGFLLALRDCPEILVWGVEEYLLKYIREFNADNEEPCIVRMEYKTYKEIVDHYRIHFKDQIDAL
jgi:hypothetical protein